MTNALPNFQIKRGFRIDLVADSSLVSSPVAMAFDENGRLFVAEMRDYPDRRNESPHLGRIRLLEDTDGDGAFDASTVYADDIPWPSAVAVYNGSVFVAAVPDILHFKDTTGSGIADIRRVVFTGFGATNTLNADHLVNSLAWGLDNRIHAVTAGIDGVVSATGVSNAPSVSLVNRDFSFDPRALTLAAESGVGGSGLCFDERGWKFVSDYEHPLELVAYNVRYRERNPFFAGAPELLDVASPVTVVYRLTPAASPASVPPRVPGVTQPLRTGVQVTNLLVAGWLTNARSSLVYRGTAFPSNYFGSVFVADLSAHLVHHELSHPGGMFATTARAIDEPNAEFLASSDLSFQPTAIVNGPDGTLYIADLQGGGDQGRIFRVAPTTFKPMKPAALGRAPVREAVAALASPNAWHRESAARLLHGRRDPTAVPLLTNVLSNSRLPAARLQALWTLDGIGALGEAQLLRGLRDADERVREKAVALSEHFATQSNVSDTVWAQLQTLVGDSSIRVRYQLAFTLGHIRRPERVAMLAQLLRSNLGNPWMQTAVFSSLSENAGDLFVTLASDPGVRSASAGEELLRQLTSMIGARGSGLEVSQVLGFIERDNLDVRQSFSLLATLGESLHWILSSLPAADPGGRLGRFYVQALAVTVDETRPEPLRVEATRLLASSPYIFTDLRDTLLLLLSSPEPQALQSAAIYAMGRLNDPRLASDVLGYLKNLSSGLRKQALSALLTRSDRAPAVLEAVGKGIISRADLTSVQINLLRTHPDPAVSRRAIQLFGAFSGQRQPALEQYKPVLKAAGDAGRGRQLFLARCSSCHQLGGEGQLLGPRLDGVRVYGKSAVLDSILEPSARVRPAFSTRVIQTRDGELFTGIIADEGQLTLIIRQPGGASVILPRANVESIQSPPWSLMPDGLEQGLSVQDVADLLEHLLTARFVGPGS